MLNIVNVIAVSVIIPPSPSICCDSGAGSYELALLFEPIGVSGQVEVARTARVSGNVPVAPSFRGLPVGLCATHWAARPVDSLSPPLQLL